MSGAPVWLAAESGIPQRCDRIAAALADALETGGIGSIDRIQLLREVAADLKKRRPLSREDRLAVDELLCRADRCIGLMIRRGQEEGWMRRNRQGGGPGRAEAPSASSPRQYLDNGRGMTNVYALTDNLTDSQFERILTEARAAGDLSRSALVRRARAATQPASWLPDPRLASKRRRPAAQSDAVRSCLIALQGTADRLRMELAGGLTESVGADTAAAWSAEVTKVIQLLSKARSHLKEAR